MDFFTHQERARAQTRRMLVLFTLAVIAIVVAVDVVVILALGMAGDGFQPGVLVTVSVTVIAVIGLATLYRTASLRDGGAAVALQLGAVRVPPDTINFAYRRLRNVVEEIAIASGVPVPEVFVLEDELGINAFASGYAPTDAAVTVTRGCLDKLTREELQGVIAHEFSHVLNGDMRLNIQLMGVAFGILVISLAGRKIVEASGRSRSRDSGGIVMLGIGLIVVGSIGIFFARIIKASISRQREYLADASAVQFTRQVEGISGALKKIGGLAEGSRLDNGDAEEVSHMLFGEGGRYSALFATHPQLTDRIKRVDPKFDPTELAAIARAWGNPVSLGEAAEGSGVSIAGFAPAGVVAAVAPSSGSRLPTAQEELQLDAHHVVAQVGSPESDDYRAASDLHATIPQSLRAAAYANDSAIAVIFALLLNAQADVRMRQLGDIEKRYDTATRRAVQSLATAVATLHPMQRLPLAALTFPALRRRPRPHLQIFLVAVNDLINADNRITVSEYCLARLIGVQVIEALDPATGRAMGRVKLPDVARELADVFGVVAYEGHDEWAAAARAYALGLHEVLPGAAVDFSPPSDWSLALDRALPKLDLLAPAGKELLVRGLTVAISEDGRVSVAEAELLRTICACLHCPLPPLLQQS